MLQEAHRDSHGSREHPTSSRFCEIMCSCRYDAEITLGSSPVERQTANWGWRGGERTKGVAGGYDAQVNSSFICTEEYLEGIAASNVYTCVQLLISDT